MLGLAGSYAFLFQHPIVGLIVLALVAAGALAALSGGQVGSSLGAMVRVFVTIFTTPFVFLRDATRIIRASGADERDYQRSRVFMLFRLSRIQYLVLLVLCLLTLAGGITTSVVALYPAAEIERFQLLGEQITAIEGELDAANTAAAEATAPDYRERLANQRDEARASYQRQLRSNAEFVQGKTFTGGIITQISSATNASTVVRIRQNIDYYMSGCPRGYNWRGMTTEACAQYRAFANDLAGRRIREFELASAAADAERAWRDADLQAQRAAEHVQDVQRRLELVRQERAGASPWSADTIRRHLLAAGAGLLATLWSVIVMVWFGATAISLLSWLILMMRTLEIGAIDRLAARRLSAGEPEPEA